MKRTCENCAYMHRDKSMSPCSRCVDNVTIKVSGSTSMHVGIKKQCVTCANSDMVTKNWHDLEGPCYDCAMNAKLGDLFPMWEPNEYFDEEGYLI